MNIFSSIVDGVDGRLVWAYLKPIVEGSILYSPDIPPVRRIIEKVRYFKAYLLYNNNL